MANIKQYDVLGKEVGTIEANDNVFSIEPHEQAMFDTVLSERANTRQGTSKVKTRGEVRGGGRKPWKQKHTGNARQGTIRAPQWKGGGTVFGPSGNQNYTLKVNKKVKKLAYKSALSQQLAAGAMLAVKEVKFDKPSTKDFSVMVKNLKLDNQKVLFILEGEAQNVIKSGRNIKGFKFAEPSQLTVQEILNANKIVLTEGTIKDLGGRY